MSEEKRKMSAFEAFSHSQLTYAEAEEKAKQEAGRPKVDRFRIGEDGEYSVRILPLAPQFDADGNILPMERKGYECAVHQLFLGIKVPSKKGAKPKKTNIPVIRATDKEVGFSVDLIDTYVKIAQEMYADDEELIKLLSSNSYSGGLRWNYQHAMMLLDVSSEKERAKGPQLWQCSHNQYKDIDAAKMRLWRDLREDNGQETCPISGFTDAYPVKIIRSNNNGKTEYTVEIGRKKVDIKEEEAEKLLELPRIHEQIYRYTKYQMEATLVYLQQYDEEHGMEVCKEPDFVEAVKKLKGELPAEDNSHFNLTEASNKSTEKVEVSINSLFNEYDAITEQGLGEKSDEYLDLRERIRQFIEDKNLDVRISRSKNNLQLLNEIEEILDSGASSTSNKDTETESEPVPAPSRHVSRSNQEDDLSSSENAEQAEETPVEPSSRRRRPRPGNDAEEEPTVSKPVSEPDEAPESEEQPRRRLHTRRVR